MNKSQRIGLMIALGIVSMALFGLMGLFLYIASQ